ncbi:zinc fingers and homeoboxes protein 1 [Hyla sarda]|uniref:zinc fingers and homeoboxes protein 1 n=1 Tax=Hyla sarda TaxID=327740 RepID=UPI0024C37870|nr:zinc fingers and homeoboxes protein 1 [Hyla sarda]XP_056378686.1 zinc fingers and homeoboxes protein 1 [Hyla sarda]
MASKRKTKTPCMVLASELDHDLGVNSDGEECPTLPTPVEQPVPESTVPENLSSEDDALEPNDSDNQQNKVVEGGYECKYCSFQTTDLNMFTFHVDSEHPTVVLNSSYFCVECNFLTKRYDSLSEHNTKYHPGEDNFKLTMVKRNNQSIFEQTVNDLTFDGSFVQEENQEQSESNSNSAISISKTPIMKIMKDKSEKKRISVQQNTSEDGTEENDQVTENEPKPKSQENRDLKQTVVVPEPVKTSATVVTSVQELPSTVITPANVLQPGVAQVITTVQAQQNILSKVLIPLNSIPTYNTAMDSNPLLLSNYNKFPYPTVSEITLLASQTKCTEEQIKIWFSAQRLKHGVSWTPEEVEDARRRQFNGTVHTVPQTITVFPAQISSAANGLPSILQTCQIVGQPSLVLAQVGGTSTIPVTTPIALTVAGVPSNAQLHASQLPHTQAVSETKKVAAVPSAQLPKQEPTMLTDLFGMRSKKTKEQLTALKISYLKNPFPSNSEIDRLIRFTGLTKGEIKKWFSDTRYNQRNSKGSHGIHFPSDSGTIIIDSSDETAESPTPPVITPQRRQSWNAFPAFTPQRFKEKTVEQLQILEESYLQNNVPTDEELNRLRVLSKLTRREIDAWFAERRRSSGVKDEPAIFNDDEGIKEEMDPENAYVKAGAALASKLVKKTPDQLHKLKSFFVRNQWPNGADYDKLAEETGLARSDVVGWFGDTRYAVKNHHLKWFYQYQVNGNLSPNAVNGQGFVRKRGRGRPRGRGRGRPRGRPKGSRKANNWEWAPPPPVKPKIGKAVLKDYYLLHKYLNEEDLDELVAKSQMGYEQVREWFSERLQREDAGLDPFEIEDEEDLLDDQEEEEEIDTDESDNWEPPKHIKRRLSKMED